MRVAAADSLGTLPHLWSLAVLRHLDSETELFLEVVPVWGLALLFCRPRRIETEDEGPLQVSSLKASPGNLFHCMGQLICAQLALIFL